MVIYLDTSAMLKLYVEEEGRELAREAVDAAELAATSTVAYAEARAGLARRWREGDFTDDDYRRTVEDLDNDWLTYARLDTSNPVSNHAGELAERLALKGFDSIHLASALRLSERFEDLQFLAFDNRLNEAARETQLSVYGNETGAG